MNTFAVSTAEVFDAPKLRLLPTKVGAASKLGRATAGGARRQNDERPLLHIVPRHAPVAHPVLVAGANPAGRAAVLRELTEAMPPSTIFAEAEAFWEVLVRAPSSSMVILSGELDELPAESLMQKLAHRHPGLPVVGLHDGALTDL